MDATQINQGKCEVCGNDIMVAKWVTDITQPTTCSRKCAEEKLAESREVDTVRGVKREKPSNEELTQVYIDSKKRINPVAKHFKVTWALAKDWLKEAGLIDTWNKPIVSEGEKELNQAERNVEETRNDQEKTEMEYFSPQDDEPMPYQVVEEDIEDKSLDDMKVIWIQNVTENSRLEAKTKLRYIGAIAELRA